MKEYPWTSTFGGIKYGTPSGKLMELAKTERTAPKITPENWFFMTGTLWKNLHLHNDRCGEKCVDCKCSKTGGGKC